MKLLSKITAAALFSTLISCSDNDQHRTAPSSVRIAPVITRVTDLNFENEDRIGLSIVNSDGVYADNTLMTFGNGIFSSDMLIWYPDATKTSALTAYYPYDPSGVPTEFSVLPDQTAEGYAASDLLVSVKPNVIPSEAAINMVFKHLLSKLDISVTNNSGSNITAVTIGGSIASADIDVASSSVNAKQATASEIEANTVTAGSRYRAIIVPQTATLKFSVATTDGKTRTISSAAQQLLSGAQYTVALTIEVEKISVSIKGEISGWEDGGEIGLGDNEQIPASDRIEYQGVSYATTTLPDGTVWMSENLRYIPSGRTVSSTPSDQSGLWYPCTLDLSASASPDFIALNGLLYDLPTATGETAVSKNNHKAGELVRGICPEGWHIPTRSDLETLAAYCNSSEGHLSMLRKTGIVGIDGTYKGQRNGSGFTKGYLLGATPTDEIVPADKYDYMLIESTAGITSYSPQAGVPVRCVKDVKRSGYSL